MNLICGINPVLEALAAGTRHFDRLLVVKGLRNPRVSDAIARASQRGIPLRFEARETLDRMAGGVAHQGLIAVVSAKAALDLESVLDQARAPALVAVLDGVEDPRNLGAILRSAEASGADGVILPERHSAGLSETVGRASAGALEHVRVARVGNLSQAIDRMKARGLWVVGFDAAGPERWDAVDYKRPLALVFGGEGRGIRRLVREHCDQLVSIPLFGHVASLNVSVAAGIALFEVVRQRGSVPSHVRPIPVRSASPAPPQVIGPDAGDAEQDPGRHPHHVFVAEDDDHDDAEDDHAPVSLVHLHEDERAWGQRAPREEERDENLRRRHRKQRPRPEGRPGPPAPRPAQASQAPGEAPREGRRRRRRGRRGRPGPDAAAGGGSAASPPRGVEGGSGEPRAGDGAGAPGPADSPGSQPSGPRRGRRHRRRR
jgi:23S rRNA (guanosine2251-2'-O)-methyltransferase